MCFNGHEKRGEQYQKDQKTTLKTKNTNLPKKPGAISDALDGQADFTAYVMFDVGSMIVRSLWYRSCMFDFSLNLIL